MAQGRKQMISEFSSYLQLDSAIENRLRAVGLTAPLWGDAEASDPVGAAFLNLVENCLQHVCETDRVTSPIRFAVSHAWTPQAYAFHNDGAPFFVITMGLARGLTSLSRHLALSDWLFIDGLPEGWIPKRPEFRERQAGLLHLFFDNCSLLSNADQAVSTLLSRTATTFIVMHELGHLVNGHLASGVYASGVLEETGSEADLDLALTRRALEYDADAFAVQKTLRIASGYVGRPSIFGDVTTPAQLIKFVMAGVATAQLFFETFDPSFDEAINTRTHPPAWMRLHTAMGMFDAIHARDMRMPPWRDLDIPHLKEMALAGREIALSDSGLPFMGDALGGPKAGALMSAFTDDVRRRWLELRPRLTEAKLGVHNLAR